MPVTPGARWVTGLEEGPQRPRGAEETNVSETVILWNLKVSRGAARKDTFTCFGSVWQKKGSSEDVLEG